MTRFDAAFDRASGEKTDAAREALATIWHRVSRAVPPLPLLGSLAYTERTPEERLSGYQPMCRGDRIEGLLECYGTPPLREDI